MKKILALVIALTIPSSIAAALGASTAGCTTTGPVVPTNVISVAQTVSATAQAVVDDAQAVWPVILPTIPAANQAAAQDAFNKAVFTANHVILTLNDAIQVAIAANNPSPDFTAIFSQLADAVAQVVSIVQQFQSSSMTRTINGVDVMADMNSAVAHLREAAKK